MSELMVPVAAEGYLSVLKMGNCMSEVHGNMRSHSRRRHTVMLQEKTQEGAWIEHFRWGDQLSYFAQGLRNVLERGTFHTAMGKP